MPNSASQISSRIIFCQIFYFQALDLILARIPYKNHRYIKILFE